MNRRRPSTYFFALLLALAGICAAGLVVATTAPSTQPAPSAYVDASQFGEVGDGIHDDAPAINAAIQFVELHPACRGVTIGAGICRLGSPLKIWPTSSNGQPSIVLRGLLHPAGFTGGQNQTVFRPDFGNAPILSIQTGRGVVVEGIVFAGPLKPGMEPSYAQVFDPTYFAAAAVRDARYSPQCAIAFDPSGLGAPPADGGYLSVDYSHRLNGSSNCIVRDCVIRNCVVGVLVDPNGVNSNSSELLFERLAIKACKVGYACGGTQAKVVTFRDNIITGVHTAFDTVNYGPGKGRPPRLVSGGSIGICARIADYATDGGGTAFEGVSGESIGSLGTFGPNISGVPSVSSFDGCELLFNSNAAGATPDWLVACQLLTIRDSTLATDHLLRGTIGLKLKLDSVRINPYGTISPNALTWWNDSSKVVIQ